jgi:fructokinase
MSLKWGIDLGGSKIEGVVFQTGTASADVLARIRIATEQEGGYEHIIGRIATLVDRLGNEVQSKPRQIGIGTPGTLDPKTGLLKNSNTACLNHQPVRRDLENRLEIPVFMANDANCFTLAEVKLGSGSEIKPPPHVAFGVIMGTGVGGGLVIDGKIWHGAQGIAGEWGHNPLIEDGRDCYCGKKGCIETVISGPALEHFYTVSSGRKKRLSEIVDLARSDADEHARATLDRLIFYFGRAIAQVMNIVDPDVIILGGGLSNIKELYTFGVQFAGQFIFNDRLETKFLKPKLGDSAGVFGAALLASSNADV